MLRKIPSSRPFYFRLIGIILICCLSADAQGQLCNGSLGDPVVNITFGDGTSGNTGGYIPTNAYTYTSSQCPNDGYYTITRSTAGCFGNSWHTVSTDHTGNGAFMLVNASYAPGDFFLANVTDLCPNTTYEFAAWIMNVLNRSGIKPNITFKIETTAGAVLQQFSTGDIPEDISPTWKQYGFFFTTPPNNPGIVLRMTNNAPGGGGNDIALDDITFRPCSSVRITSTIQGNSTDTVNICDDVTNVYTLKGSLSAGYVSPVYNWQLSTDSGATWKDISSATTLTYVRTATVAGAYWYRLSVVEKSSAGIPACRVASNYVVINVHGKPLVNAGGKRVMISGHGIILNGEVKGENPLYYWDPPEYLSDINSATPLASPVADKKYTLYAITPFGCSNQDTASIKVIAGIFVPSAFTPNNDGKNDNWRIPFLDPVLGAEVNVFNRYGQLVYRAEGAVVDWDGNYKGQPQLPGAYVFSIHFKNDYPDMKGTVLLIR